MGSDNSVTSPFIFWGVGVNLFLPLYVLAYLRRMVADVEIDISFDFSKVL